MDKNILFIIIAAAVGLFFGIWISRQKKQIPPNPEQEENKQKNLDKVMGFATKTGQVTNADVQTGLSVSDATATRYLEELEKQGKLRQIGDRGKQVVYRLK